MPRKDMSLLQMLKLGQKAQSGQCLYYNGTFSHLEAPTTEWKIIPMTFQEAMAEALNGQAVRHEKMEEGDFVWINEELIYTKKTQFTQWVTKCHGWYRVGVKA